MNGKPGRKFKYIAILVLLPFILYFSLLGYFLRGASITDLVLCALEDKVTYIPKHICYTYLVNFRNREADISALAAADGLQFVFAGYALASQEQRQQTLELADTFIEKGLDVNQVSLINGLTPMHAVILANNPELVKYLIQKGADISIKDNSDKLIPLEFAEGLMSTDTNTDRSAVIQILKGEAIQ
ncbi:MAG: ankyrin repeat domain-containing protein [Gammaproteobacteria bacterium]|nr:ankyrin repeat domain-containing protein [Gammaproteobacteria bacterium]